MKEVEEAWRLWNQLQQLSEALWQRYENAFMEFIQEEDTREDKDLPFKLDTTCDSNFPF